MKVWVRDLIKCEEQFLHSLKNQIFLSILSLCWLFGYIDYALELIDHEILGIKLEEVEKTALLTEGMDASSIKEDSITFLTKFWALCPTSYPLQQEETSTFTFQQSPKSQTNSKRFLGKG